MKPTIITLFATLLLASCGEQPKKEKTETQEITVETKEETAAPQLRHVVLFKFNETSSAEEIALVEASFDALPSKISEIKAYEKGLNNSPENLNKELTHCFLLTFESEKDRDTYLTHPDHVAFTEIAGPHIADVLVVDYWAK